MLRVLTFPGAALGAKPHIKERHHVWFDVWFEQP
jgi:hypothetical protein